MEITKHVFVRGAFLPDGTMEVYMEDQVFIAGVQIPATEILRDFRIRFSSPFILNVKVVSGTAKGLQAAPKRPPKGEKPDNDASKSEKGKGKRKKGFLGVPGKKSPATQSYTSKEPDMPYRKHSRTRSPERQKTANATAASAASQKTHEERAPEEHKEEARMDVDAASTDEARRAGGGDQ